MQNLPAFTLEDIRPYFGPGAWARGLAYARYGHILNAQVEGPHLYADCQGSQPYAYQVQAVWQHGELGARCSCSMGAKGDCKHIAALLVTFVEHPEEFAQIGNMDVLLAQASPEQLRSALGWVLKAYPQTLPGARHWLMDAAAWTAELVRQDVLRLVSWGDRDGEDNRELLCENMAGADGTGEPQFPGSVVAWRERMDVCLQEGNLRAAFEIGKGLTLGLRKNMRRGLGDPTHVCLLSTVSQLTELLAQARDQDLRAMTAELLIMVHGWEDNAAERALGDLAQQALVDHLDADERRMAARAIKEELLLKNAYWGPTAPSARRGDLLYALLQQQLQIPQDLLDLAIELHDLPTQIDALLSLGRLDEALVLLEHVDVYHVGQYVAAFARHQQQDAALNWLLAESQKTEGHHAWLHEMLRQYGRWADLLSLHRPFALGPASRTHIAALREAAQHLGVWEEERSALVGRLAAQGDWTKIVDLYLGEGLFLDALDALDQIAPGGDVRDLQGYREEVARVVEQECPLQAALIYAESVELCISKRTRADYAQAAQWLLRIRKCYLLRDQHDAWLDYMQDLQDEYMHLRALADELRKIDL